VSVYNLNSLYYLFTIKHRPNLSCDTVAVVDGRECPVLLRSMNYPLRQNPLVILEHLY